MPPRLIAPVLTLDATKMNQVDTRNVESLFGMWTLFNKCSQNIKDGSRLENLSWRLWARETLCCPPQPEKTIVPTIDVPLSRTTQPSEELPSLSNSPGGSDDSGSEGESDTPRKIRTKRYSLDMEDSALSKSRGKEPHLTSGTLKNMVVQIQTSPELGPLSPSIEASIPPVPTQLAHTAKEETSHPVEEETAQPVEEEDAEKSLRNSTESGISGTTFATTSTLSNRKSDHRSSDTSVSSDGLIRSGSVVHGFSPVSSSFRQKSLNGLPVPSSRLGISPAKKTGMFQLGASSEDDEGSFETRTTKTLKPPPQRSSLSQSLTRQQIAGGLQKKTTSFRDIVEQRRMDSDAEADEGAIATDSEDGDSVFDEDGEEDWEDSPSDEERSSIQPPPNFRRVESRPDLVSRPSMLSMQLDQRRRTSGLQNEASRSSPAFRRSRAASPNGPSMPGSPEDHDEEPGLVMRGAKTQPRPIAMPPPTNQSSAHSPRTTRRNMLSTELTESLRKNLLWERQQKSQTVNAFLKRNRNAQSMANLQGALKPPPRQPEHRSNNSWSEEFDNPWEFNTKGW